MKKHILILTTLTLFALSAHAELAFDVSITAPGGFTEADKLAAIDQIEKENVRRAGLETPLPALPYSTLQEIAASYETIHAQIAKRAHTDYVRQATERGLKSLLAQLETLWPDATDAQRTAAASAALAALQE